MLIVTVSHNDLAVLDYHRDSLDWDTIDTLDCDGEITLIDGPELTETWARFEYVEDTFLARLKYAFRVLFKL